MKVINILSGLSTLLFVQSTTRFIRSVTACVVLILFVSVGSLSAAGTGGRKGSTEGTFVGIGRDDQSHFLIKDLDGRDHSFLLQSPDESVKPFLDNPAKCKGRPVKVYWVTKLTGDGLTFVVVKVE